MEDKSGIIFDKFVQIKFLILFVMSRLTGPITMEQLTELTLCDDRINYFDVTQCIAQLTESGILQLTNDKYRLTTKGKRNAGIADEQLPYSVRKKAEKASVRINEILKVDTLVNTQYSELEKGGYRVRSTLSDGMGEILAVELYVADVQQAEKIEAGFRKNAQTLYKKILALITK